MKPAGGAASGVSRRFERSRRADRPRLRNAHAARARLIEDARLARVGAEAVARGRVRPLGVVRHSHEPLDAAAEQTPSPPHCPRHSPSVKRHGWGGSVVVVLVGATPTGPRFAGAHTNCAPLKTTIRAPNWSCISAVGVNGRLHFV